MKIATDKLLHFTYSAVIAFIVATLTAMAFYQLAPASPGLRTIAAFVTAIVLTLAIGVYKELHDRLQPGNHFCWRDLLADLFGALLGSLGAFVSYLI